MAEHKTVYQIITDRFIDQLAAGEIPWKKPWISIGGARVGAWSHSVQSKGRPYSLLNQMVLPKEGEYITMRQIQEEGGQLRRGSKGYPVFFYKTAEIETKNEQNVLEKKRIPVLRYYTVFHIDDVDGIDQRYKEDLSPLDGLKEPGRCKRADELIKDYSEREHLEIIHKAQDRAFYSPMEDKITVPLKKQFVSKPEYYSTVFHEITHSTGHRSRLNRFKVGLTGKRGSDYSLEELVAEIGASAIMYNLRLETNDSITNSNAYLQGWLKALNTDTRMISNACSRAEKAVNLIYGITKEAFNA